jgi:hypothetical protein
MARKFHIGDKVRIDTDNKEWGRVVSDGMIEDIDSRGHLLVNVSTIRANIYVPQKDIHAKQDSQHFPGGWKVGEKVYPDEFSEEMATIKEIYVDGRSQMAVLKYADGHEETTLTATLGRPVR